MGQTEYPNGYDTGASNHPTVVPTNTVHQCGYCGSTDTHITDVNGSDVLLCDDCCHWEWLDL